MASAASALCGGDSAMEVEETPAGGNVAGETSEPNFDENVLKAKARPLLMLRRIPARFRDLTRGEEARTETKDRNPKSNRNPKSEIRNGGAGGCRARRTSEASNRRSRSGTVGLRSRNLRGCVSGDRIGSDDG